MNPLDERRIDEALTRFGETLDMDLDAPLEVIVCGGAALNIAGYVRRTTTDVDVLGFLDVEEGEVERPELPREFERARKEVQEELGLQKRWINTGPSLLVPAVPEGLTDRLEAKPYSDKFVVHILGRRDQVFLKTYASIDEPDPHRSDLRELEPTEAELIEATMWAVSNYPPDWPREPVVDEVEDVLEFLGKTDLMGDLEKIVRDSGDEGDRNSTDEGRNRYE